MCHSRVVGGPLVQRHREQAAILIRGFKRLPALWTYTVTRIQNAQAKIEAIDRIVEILSSALERPEMYFDPLEPSVVEDWLAGLHAGVSVFGLEWNPEHRRVPLATRGLELTTIRSEVDDLRKRGMNSLGIVKELLSIEVEMWTSQRRSFAK